MKKKLVRIKDINDLEFKTRKMFYKSVNAVNKTFVLRSFKIKKL